VVRCLRKEREGGREGGERWDFQEIRGKPGERDGERERGRARTTYLFFVSRTETL